MASTLSNPTSFSFQLTLMPSWASQHETAASAAEAAYLAGAALNPLDAIVRSEAVWLGAWRQRLALRNAAAAVTLAGRREDERGLRDTWILRRPGDALGPSGQLLKAWRDLGREPPVLSLTRLTDIANLLALRWSQELDDLPGLFDQATRSHAMAPDIVVAMLRTVLRLRPDAELLAWWLADLALARRMRWPVAIPLLMAHRTSPGFRAKASQARLKPGDAGFEQAVYLACARASAQACQLAGDIARSSERLSAVTPKLRAKGARDAIALLCDEDAVSGAHPARTLSRWAARRLFERLHALGAVRELSGRASFRLYGL